MVEMALVLPVIILCIGILITAGQLIFAKMTCQMAAYEGARKAVVMSSYNEAKNTAINKSQEVLRNGIGLSNVSFEFNAPSWTKGNFLTYTVKAKVKTLFPVIGSDFTFKNESEVRGHIVLMIERN